MNNRGKRLNPIAKIFQCSSGTQSAVHDLETFDELYEVAPVINKDFNEFMLKLAKLVGGSFDLGELKLRNVAEDKANRDNDGRPEFVCDLVRGKLIVDSPESILALEEALAPENPENNELFEKYGVFCAQLRNYFKSPKYETDYRCLNAKLSFPIGNTGKRFLCELQVVHEKIEETYDLSHWAMRKAQEITNKYEDEEIPDVEAYKRQMFYSVCKFYNATAARKAGLNLLLENEKDALTKIEADELFEEIFYFYEEIENGEINIDPMSEDDRKIIIDKAKMDIKAWHQDQKTLSYTENPSYEN